MNIGKLNESIFENQHISIIVKNAEHHGSGQLHTHSFYEFVYIKRGFTLHNYNGITTILTPGDMFAIRPGDVHSYFSSNNTYLYNCLFLPESLENDLGKLTELPGIRNVFDKEAVSVWKRIHLDLMGQKQALEYLEKMKTESAVKSIGWELSLKTLLISFLILFSRKYDSLYGDRNESEPMFSNYIYNALAFIDGHFKENISVNDIAAAAKLSNDYLSRQFKQFIGMAPISYLKNYRFAKAIELLKNSSLPVSIVASEVGFEDPVHFTKQFKSLLGMSPSEYRKLETTGFVSVSGVSLP